MSPFVLPFVICVCQFSTLVVDAGTIKASKLPVSCDDAYMSSDGHSVCLSDNPEIVASGVSEADKVAIVALHNKIRSAVQPPAADMQKMVFPSKYLRCYTQEWNDNLAAMAQLWADQCLNEHDLLTNYAEYGELVGQNIVSGMNSWKDAIGAWERESKWFLYGSDPKVYMGDFGWLKVRHYAMLVQSTTAIVGCGYTSCQSGQYGKYYVCNYMSGYGKDASETSWMANPYKLGESCSSCPNVCDNALCDCEGRYCFHDGHLNLKTCQCECEGKFSGVNCLTPLCDKPDEDLCGSQWRPSECAFFPDTRKTCPHMCGECRDMQENNQANTESPDEDFDVNDDILSDFDVNDDFNDSDFEIPSTSPVNNTVRCSEVAKRAPKSLCAYMGMRGRDNTECITRGGTFNCRNCKVPEVKFLHCPIMCGICDVQ